MNAPLVLLLALAFVTVAPVVSADDGAAPPEEDPRIKCVGDPCEGGIAPQVDSRLPP